MNLNRVYRDQIYPKKDIVVKPVEEDAGKVQAKINWKESNITKEMFETLGKEYSAYIEQAIYLSRTYPEHQNHSAIIALLVRADTTKKVILNYGNS